MAFQADKKYQDDAQSAVQLASAMPNAVLLCHDTSILFANQTALRLLNAANPEAVRDVALARHLRLTGAAAGRPWRQILQQRRPVAAEIVTSQGAIRPVTVTLRSMSDRVDGPFLAILEELHAEAPGLSGSTAAFNDRYRRVLDHLPTFVCLTAGGRIVYANSAAADCLGFVGPQELVGRRLEEIMPGPDNRMVNADLSQLADQNQPTTLELRGVAGETVAMSIDVRAVEKALPIAGGEARALYLISSDGTGRAAAADRTGSRDSGANRPNKGESVRSATAARSSNSGRDALTRLADRSTFTDYLQQALREADATAQSPAVLLLDIQRFKGVNASYGVEAGDELLRHIACRLIEIGNGNMAVGRLSGDEFAMLVTDADGLTDILGRAARLIDVMAQPYQVFNDVITISANVGVAAFPIGGDSPAALLQNAELARSKARELGANRYFLFDSELDTKVRRRKELESEIERGLRQTEFVNFYQPQIDLGTGAVVGGEALVRWQHPDRGLIMPDTFIPITEELGAIRELTELMLYRACRDVAAWDEWIDEPCVAVNLSPAVLMQGNFFNTVRDVLRETGTPAERLELEITESVIMRDVFEVGSMLEEIRSLGVRLAIDDFGTGHSSLSYLKRLPIQKLKIDRSFITDLPNDRNDVSITRAIVVMAQNLGMTTLAEGVENAEQVAFLRGIGCDEAQGFHFGRAIASENFLEWCARHNNGASQS
jgi:diguanylate cyclase (GGDEF)-like protein/PAS domain S-box-containing protein